MNVFIVICAWCDKVLGKKPSDTPVVIENCISHSMCEDCHDRELNKTEQLSKTQE